MGQCTLRRKRQCPTQSPLISPVCQSPHCCECRWPPSLENQTLSKDAKEESPAPEVACKPVVETYILLAPRWADKGLYSQSYSFFPVVMYRCESWALKKAECCRTDAFELEETRKGMLEKALESPLDSKETKPVHPKGNQP